MKATYCCSPPVDNFTDWYCLSLDTRKGRKLYFVNVRIWYCNMHNENNKKEKKGEGKKKE